MYAPTQSHKPSAPTATVSRNASSTTNVTPSLSDLLQEPAVALLRGAMQRRRLEQQPPSPCGGDDHGGASCACVVCYEAPRDAVFLPCGHSGTCLGCALDVYRTPRGLCPLCRTRIDQIVTLGPRAVMPASGLMVAEVAGPVLLCAV